MFIHNFKYTFIALFKNKMLIFWTFAFPIILGTFFNMAFSNIEKNEVLDIIDIAIVDNDEFENNETFKEAFKILGDNASEKQLFNIKYVSEEEAKDLLVSGEIKGYMIIKEKTKVVIDTNGIDETILKYVVEEISQTDKIVKNIAEEEIQKEIENAKLLNNEKINLDKIYSEIYDRVLLMMNNDSNIEDVSSENLSYIMIEFYTLIAMACLYSGVLGMVAINQISPNMSNNGKRISVAPVSKRKLIISSVLASYCIQLIGLFLLFTYTIFVLKVDYGNNLFYVILLTLVGCLAGLSLGVAVATLFKGNDNLKTGIVISITMLGCFFAGMMGISMKYLIDKKFPILNKVNPASMITDGFYALYYYDTLERFYFDVISLLIFAFIMIGLSVISLRRQKYDSI